MLGKVISKWKDIVALMNSKGIPMPTIRDPKTGQGSISCTLVFVSSLMVIIGLMGKWSKYLGDVDISNSLQFFYASAALYFGRNLKQANGGGIGAAPASADDQPKPPATS